MSNLDNNMNINNAGRTYHRNIKKGEEAKPQATSENFAAETTLHDGTKAAESYGRILVKSQKIDNADMVKSVKEALDFYIKNPELARLAVKAGDDAYELLEAMDEECAYEKACCGSCDAAYSKNN